MLLGKTSRPDWLTCGVPKSALIDKFSVKIMTGEEIGLFSNIYMFFSCQMFNSFITFSHQRVSSLADKYVV